MQINYNTKITNLYNNTASGVFSESRTLGSGSLPPPAVISDTTLLALGYTTDVILGSPSLGGR